MPTVHKYKNRKYGKLQLSHKVRSGGQGVGAIWAAICECGKVVEVLARKVRAGHVVSCGNCGSNTGSTTILTAGIPEGHKVHFRSIIQKCKAGTISTTDYLAILKGRCIGCNTQPVHGELESSTSTQLVPICRDCSRWRGGRNVLEWLEHSIRVADSVRSRVGQ